MVPGRICIAAIHSPRDIRPPGLRQVSCVCFLSIARRVQLVVRPPRQPLSRPVARKRKRVPRAFSGYESFVYLLTELETVVDSGTIRWPAAALAAARVRLELLAASLTIVAGQIEDH